MQWQRTSLRKCGCSSMSIAKALSDIHPDFLQECPLCGRDNRIVMKGVYKLGDKVELQPDMGYSFCNCKAIFYTNSDNLWDEIKPEPDEQGVITYPDPFFAWPDPYQFHYLDVRRYQILWDMDSMCEQLEADGYEVIRTFREFDVHSNYPQHFHIIIRKP